MNNKIIDEDYFIPEIQQMMYNFGDCSKPLLESAKLVSSIILNNLIKILYQLEEICILRESKIIGMEEILYLYRKNYVKLKLIMGYLRFKDMKSTYIKGTGVENEEDALVKVNSTKRLKLCSEFLSLIDSSGSLLALIEKEDNDKIKLERYARLERLTRNMNPQEYQTFSAARQVSFTKNWRTRNFKASTTSGICKFKNWILPNVQIQFELNQHAWEILGFLAREMLGELVEYSLLMRKGTKETDEEEPSSHQVPPIKINSHLRYAHLRQYQFSPLNFNSNEDDKIITADNNTVTDGSNANESKWGINVGCSTQTNLSQYRAITVSEIREAVRRMCVLREPLSINSKCIPVYMNERLLF